MARKKESPRGAIGSAVYELRTGLKERQRVFADRLGVSVSTLVRFEGNRVIPAKILIRLKQIAQDGKRQDLAQFFAQALADQAGTPHQMNVSSHELLPSTSEEKEFVRALLFVFRAEESSVEHEKASLKRVLGPTVTYLAEENRIKGLRDSAILQIRDALENQTPIEKLVQIYQIRQIADVLFNYDPSEDLINAYAAKVVVELSKAGVTPDQMPTLYKFSKDAAVDLAKKNRVEIRSRRSRKSKAK